MIGGKSVKSKKKTTTQIICQNLGLSYQTIFQDYKCTLKTNFSFFGRLYIGEQHLMFVSNMFGIVKKAAILIDSISRITQPSIEIISILGKDNRSQHEQEFTFSGFKNDNAFKIIRALWKKEKLSSEVLNANDQQPQQSDKSSLRNLDDANMQINLFNPQKVETEKQKMLEIVLPCSVEQFYRFFIADDANVYSKKKHLEFKKGRDVVATPWKHNTETNSEVRELTAVIKVTGVPFKSEASMSQVWFLDKHSIEEIRLRIITQMADVPYSAYFQVEEQVVVSKQGESKCKYLISSGVVFNKATYMKGTIINRTFQDLQEDYKLWSDNVKEILDKMKKNQDSDNRSDKKKSSSFNNVQFEEQKMGSERFIADSSSSPPSKDVIVDKDAFKAEIMLLKDKVNKLTLISIAIAAMVGLNLLLNLYNTFTK